MYVRTWQKHQQFTPIILTESLLSMATTYTCLHPKKTSWGGLCTFARTWHAHFSMLVAQQMPVLGGPAQKRPAWTKTIQTLVYTSISCLVVQVEQATCHTSGGHLLTLWTLQWSSWRGLGTKGEPNAGVRNVKDLKILGTFYGRNGLNSRDEIKARSRVKFVGSWRNNFQKFNFVSFRFLNNEAYVNLIIGGCPIIYYVWYFVLLSHLPSVCN